MASLDVHVTRGIFLLVCCFVFAGTACTSEDEPRTAEDAANLLADEMDSAQLVPGDADRQALTEDDDIAPDLVIIDTVAECMRAEGFDYVAALPEEETSTRTDLAHGYGIVASVIAPEPDPNEAILEELSPTEQESYLVALWGDPVADTYGCAGAAMDTLGDDLKGNNVSEPASFEDRDIEELRARTIALATSRPEVVDAINEAVACANDRLGANLIDDSFDFLSVAEYRVARLIDEEEANKGATLFDLVASADDGQIVLDEETVETMLQAEEEVRQVESDCRGAVQPVLRQAFVEVAAELLADDPETTAAIVEGGS